MARMRLLFECVAQAVCCKGLRALAGLVPFGEPIYDITVETWERFQSRCKEEGVQGKLRSCLEEVAQAPLAEVQREARGAVHLAAAGQPAEVQQALLGYLTHMPGTIRRTLKRPADPSGTTVSPGMSLDRPEQLVQFLPTRLPRFKPGDRPVSNWLLEELLGTGGFGEVWKARHPQLEDMPPVALKFCLDPAAGEFLRHEAKLLARIRSQGRLPGIVTLQQAYLDVDPVCLEYEYVNGGDLGGLLQQMAAVPAARRVGLANQTVSKLARIIGRTHRLVPPIVHRDLKPANILVRRTDHGKLEVLVADFGIGGVAAQRALDTARRGTTSRGDLLATALRGAHTPHYASPQQIQGEPPDPRDDVHALGVIWHQLLTGDLSTGAPTGLDWVDELKTAGLNDGLVRLLGACVAQKAAKRPADAAELGERLTQLLGGVPLEVPPAAPSGTPVVGGRQGKPVLNVPPAEPTAPEPFADVSLAENPEPRLPCVLLLDVSRSMAGGRLQELQFGLEVYRTELLADHLAAQRVEVAIVTFGSSVETLCPFTTADQFRPPTLTAGGKTPMGAAINRAVDLIEQRKRQYREHGLHYFRPWIFLVTDGKPTDAWQGAATRVRQGEVAKAFQFYAIGVEGADLDFLRAMSVREPRRLHGLRFRDLFQWLSQSQRSVSQSAPGQEDQARFANPAAPGGWASP